MKSKPIIYTIGHSNRSIKELINLLKTYGIKKVTDIRSVPKSRHNPQFNRDRLRKALKNVRIYYKHLKKLGGLRHAKKDSVNLAWQNLSFRGFADYMQTPEFEDGLKMLEKIGHQYKTAMICAEALPWRCHRWLVADALVKRGWRIFHIMNRNSAFQHKINPMLRRRKGKIIYPLK